MDEKPRKILVFLPNWVGDVVMASPMLHALREHFGSDHITHLGRRIALDTAGGGNWSDDVLEDCSSLRPKWLNFLRLVWQIRRGRYDLTVLLPNSFRTAFAARLGSAGRIIGYNRDCRGLLLSDSMNPPRDTGGKLTPLSAIDYYLHLGQMLGLRSDSRKMSLAVEKDDDLAVGVMLLEAEVDESKPLVMINPGASFGTSKMWDLTRYAAVADELIERRGVQIVINAAPSERHIAAQVADAMQHRPVINFADRNNTIGTLKAMMRHCQLLITNDTGARHVGAALGISVVTLFGSTDPQWAKIDYELERIIRIDVRCSPCQRKTCNQPPGPRYHQCMAGISTQMVLDAACDLLDRTGTP